MMYDGKTTDPDAVIVGLSELGRKHESCNITVREQSLSESYVSRSVDRR